MMAEALFIVKKFIGLLMMPLSIIAILFITGLILTLFTKRKAAGKIVLIVGAALFLFIGYGALTPVLKSIESTYPVLDLKTLENLTDKPKWVVVLGGGHLPDSRYPLISQIRDESLKRLIEGIRVYRELQGAKLLFSAGSFAFEKSEAKTMRDIAVSLGVPEADIVIEGKSWDTMDNAAMVYKIIGNQKSILITSASHMKRAMMLFKSLGMNPVPDPVGHLSLKENKIDFQDVFPKINNFKKADEVLYEAIGYVWAKIKGW